MNNEIATLPNFDVKFTPSKISVTGLEVLEQAIDVMVKKYDGLIVTSEDEKNVKSTLADIRKVKKQIDDKRKEVKRDYNTPLTEFEAQIKTLTGRLDQIIEPINNGLKTLVEQETQARMDDVNDLVAEMAPNYNLSVDEVPIDSGWLLKSLSKKKRTEQIADVMKMLQAKKEQLERDITAVEKYAKAVDVDPVGWIDQVKSGASSTDVMGRIDLTVEQRKKKAEYNKSMAELAEKQGPQVDDKTGEIITPKVQQPRLVNLQISATIDQMNQLKQFMDQNGIGYERF